MSLPKAAEQNNRKEVERLLRSGSDVNGKEDGVRYVIKHATHKFVYIFVIYIITSYVDR